MRDARPLHVLKRKLSFQAFLQKDKKVRSLRKSYSQDSLAGSEPSYHKYPVLRLNDNLSLSIGDSYDSTPRGPDDILDFEYGPIRFPKLVRLLLILPSVDQDEPLETLLFHADLNEVPFQSLSYAGGDMAKKKTMHCNGRGLSVTESLYAALLAVRHLGDSKAISILWADEVCINQADLNEREMHLKLMTDIYSSSVVTTVWLGDGGGKSHKVLETIDMFHKACKCPEFRGRLERDELDLASLHHLSVGDMALQVPCENRTELSRFFAHPWFGRIWIWQEIAAARKAVILFDGRVRPWTYIVDAAWCMERLHWESCILPQFFSYEEHKKLKHHHVLDLDVHRHGYMDGTSYRLLELLTVSRHFTTNQPLDRVFALHGLLGDVIERQIAEAFFDYKLSPLSLYLNLTINLMRSQDTLDILHLVHNDPVSRPSWPSFVPDLASPSSGRQLGSRRGRRTWEYQAAGETKPSLRIINGRCAGLSQVPHFEDDVHIALSGMIFDEVGCVGTEMKGSEFNVSTFVAGWVNTALMTDGRKFYTMGELKRAREVLKAGKARDEPQSAFGRVDFFPKDNAPSPPWSGRRPSLPHIETRRPSPPHIETRRPSVPNISVGTRRPSFSTEPGYLLRESIAPSLLDALQKIDIEAAPDSPTLPHPSSATAPQSTISSLPDHTYPSGNMTAVEAFWRTLIRNKATSPDGQDYCPPASMGKSHFEPFFTAATGSIGGMLEALQSGTVGSRAVPAFNEWIHKASVGSRIVRTRTGYIGTAPPFVEEGDLICVLYGGQTPFVLRREAWGNYRFIGDCYVHGIMDGEALTMDLDETEFVLV